MNTPAEYRMLSAVNRKMESECLIWKNGIPMVLKVKEMDDGEYDVDVFVRYWHPLFWCWFVKTFCVNFCRKRKERKGDTDDKTKKTT